MDGFVDFRINKKGRDYPWEIYTLKELLNATNNFHDDNKIGEGGFGSVYWGRTSKGVEAILNILNHHPFSFFLIVIQIACFLSALLSR